MTPIASAEKRYVLVANRLLDDIRSGRRPVGARLPTEIMLAEQFGVSRQTVREAMRRLQDMGVVARRQGVGTQVVADVPQQEASDLFTSVCDAQLEGADFGHFDRAAVLRVMATVEVAAGEAATLLRCGPSQRWLRVTGARFEASTGTPVSFNQVFLPLHYAEVAPRIGAEDIPIYRMIDEHYGVRVTDVEQEIRAAACPADISDTLGLGPGSPVLIITRHHFSAARELVEVTVSTYAAERFAYRLTLRANAVDRRLSQPTRLRALAGARS